MRLTFRVSTTYCVPFRPDADARFAPCLTVFGSWHNALLWTIPLFLAILLRLITLRYTHELIFPAYFFVVPVVFYIVVLSARIPMDALRASRWVFDVGTKKEPWYRFYTCYDFRMMDWGAFWKALPTQFASVASARSTVNQVIGR